MALFSYGLNLTKYQKQQIIENKTASEVMHSILIVTEVFINKQNFRKTLTKCQLHQ